MEHIFFNDWPSLFRTVIIGVLAYITLVFFLRFSGKRTLSKMNAFDLIVTVALGSTLATVLLNKNVSLAEGVLAFAVLIGLQYIVTWSSVRVRWVRQIVTGEPVMLLHRGEFLPATLRQTRVTRDEILAALRSAGFASLANVQAVILETDGSFSVIGGDKADGASSLDGVRNPSDKDYLD